MAESPDPKDLTALEASEALIKGVIDQYYKCLLSLRMLELSESPKMTSNPVFRLIKSQVKMPASTPLNKSVKKGDLVKALEGKMPKDASTQPKDPPVPASPSQPKQPGQPVQPKSPKTPEVPGVPGATKSTKTTEPKDPGAAAPSLIKNWKMKKNCSPAQKKFKYIKETQQSKS